MKIRDYDYCNKKINCSLCSENCNYRLSQIISDTLTRVQILKELKLHGHPQSRKNKRTKKNRNIQESISELYNHYKNHHNK